MIVKAKRSELTEALRGISKGLPTKTSFPIVEGILVEAKNGKLILTSNNLEVSIRAELDGIEVRDEGSLVLPVKLIEILKNLPEDEVEISTVSKNEGNVVEIKCGNAKFSLLPMPADEFPLLAPEGYQNEWNKIELLARDIKEIANLTLFAISNNPIKEVFNGVLMEADGDGNIVCIASDTYRIARVEKTIEQTEPFQLIVPGKNLSALAKIIDSSDDIVTCYYSLFGIVFSCGKYTVCSRLIGGRYPDAARQVLPANYLTKVTVEKDALSGILSRSTILALSGRPKAEFSVKNNVLSVTVQEDIGVFNEAVNVQYEGESLDSVIFNVRFLSELLNVIQDDQLEMEFNGARGPCVVREERNDVKFSYLCLPIVA